MDQNAEGEIAVNRDEQGLRLLLVDDEEHFLVSASKVFQRRGITVLTADRGTRALEILAEHPVDVVILDVKMPGLGGIETLERMHANYPELKVILLTGHATMESAADGMRLGAAGYLVKPVDLHELLDKAIQACGRHLESDHGP
jgi:DNA-binding NtrC family response regulator